MNDEMHHAYVAAFGAQHHELRQLVRALHEISRESRPWSREATVEADELLATLDEYLKHHFAQEEEGGYLEEALNLAPRFSAESAELLRQHPQLRDKTSVVRKTARRAVDEPAAWPQLKRDLVELIKGLMAHEGAENEIIQEAFNTGLEDLDD